MAIEILCPYGRAGERLDAADTDDDRITQRRVFDAGRGLNGIALEKENDTMP